ncbi:MAG: hypothetical protein RR514_06495, partial [Christensenella sp.]
MPTPLEISSQTAAALVQEAQTFSPAQIAALQQERLNLLVDYARAHSPYLADKYKNLPKAPALKDIPVTLRTDAMEHFDAWVCDPKVTSAALDKYLLDIENAANPFLGKYTVLTTSGTTGIPLRMVRDSRHQAVNGALMAARLLGGSKLHGITLAPNMKSAGVLASGGYHSTYLSYVRAKRAYEQMGCPERFLPLFLDMSTAEMVEKLNEFQPEMLTGYPSNMKLLALQQQKGKLHIAPKAVGSSAEYLSPETRELIEQAFGCPMIDNYCSTEGGELAMLCAHNRMHINTDWMILEPVDRDRNPVQSGRRSEGVLLTNLANLVQPIIRYYISDRILLDESPCPCGLPFPSLAIEGRQEDNLTFTDDNHEEVTVASSVFIQFSLHMPDCEQLQFVQTSPDELQLRFTTEQNHARVGAELKELCEERFVREGIANVTITISELPP